MQTKQAVDSKDYVKFKKRDILQKREFGWETAIHKILNNLSKIFGCDYRNMNTLRTQKFMFVPSKILKNVVRINLKFLFEFFWMGRLSIYNLKTPLLI